jgi:hypothetical protein
VFDEHYIERQREEIRREYQPAQQNMAAKQHIYNDIVAQQQAQNSVLGGLMGLGVGGAGGAGVFK